MSDLPKRSLETDGTREEDWEVVSGSKSMSLEPKATSQNKENEEKSKNLPENENKIKGIVEEKNISLFKDVKQEEAPHDEPEDWYQTIPLTPMNTPEYTPAAPTYPTSNRVPDDLEELTPIIEETSEDQNVFATPLEQTDAPQENQEDSQSSESGILQQSWVIIRYTLTRLVLFIVGFSIIKWSFSKACEHLNKMKQSRSKTKKNVE